MNPRKADGALQPLLRHRIITPVYIPTVDGYFAGAPDVLKICLESLFLTTRGRGNVTVICNAATPEVLGLLHRHQQAGDIDQLVINHQNRGKIDAVLAAARASFEPFITFTDSDVLFRTGWLRAVESVFSDFPEAAFVSPVPNPTLTYFCTSTTILDALVRGELSFEPVVPQLDLERFANSIEFPEAFSAHQKRAQMVIRRQNALACVGAGHFVFTIRRELMRFMPKTASLQSLADDSHWLDWPVEHVGLWRLATSRAHAHHMGNVPEGWMATELEACRAGEAVGCPLLDVIPPLKVPILGAIPHRLRSAFVAMLRKYWFDDRWRRAAAAADVEEQASNYDVLGDERR